MSVLAGVEGPVAIFCLYPLIYAINRLNQSVNPCGLALTQDYTLLYKETASNSAGLSVPTKSTGIT